MQVKPMKPWISNMFRMHKTLDVITLFHKPSLPASVRVESILKKASIRAAETAAADQNKSGERETFELDVTEAPPTPDQLTSIFEYLGAGKSAQLVKGASSQSEALKKLKESADNFQRPVVVDWNQGRAVVGDNESEILKLVFELPKES